MPAFYFERDRDNPNLILNLTDEDAQLIPLDSRERRFAAFILWAGTQQPPLLGLPANARLFTDEASLVDECKRQQKILNLHSLEHPGIYGGQITLRLGRNGETMDLFRLSNGQEGGQHPDRTDWFVGSALRQTLLDSAHSVGEVANVFDRLSERSFVYVDVSGFSKLSSFEQSAVIRSMISMVETESLWVNWNRPTTAIEASICIGDGFIYVFRSAPMAVHFAAVFADLIERRVAQALCTEFHFRIGVHTGSVYRFWDPSRNAWNYVGDGINEGNRVISAIGSDQDDVVFISGATREKLTADLTAVLPATLHRHLINRGRRADKHKVERRLYEVQHSTYVSSITAAMPFQWGVRRLAPNTPPPVSTVPPTTLPADPPTHR